MTAVETRHLGKTEPNLSHHSFVIEGSRCIWFMGDASPMQMKKMKVFPKPDVLIAPYAYANTPSAWEMTKAVGATTVVLLHLPEKTYGRVTLPEGEYRCLRITLGTGEGRNWWCVLYPELCLTLLTGEDGPKPSLSFDSLRILKNWLMFSPLYQTDP